ncbi:LamG domain-containing protein [Streptomyces ficellus]|uniref:LamG domain-containing protein n=1 Tax=Streptomyces ficellus TaxID=1977088 RepID=A0ABT7ZEA0_9ACTN|nr:LamG domain-containing protein [Streptomyces ficellus]MDN3297844.1 LamG domain-containing protein [Streptomyces ficellus]
MALIAATVVASALPTMADDAVAQAPTSAPTAALASALAAQSGEPVEVVSERSEYTSTDANPDGTFTLTQSTTPQRVKAEDGSWRDVDVALVRRSDGSIGPKAAVVDLSFSGGGSGGDLIHLAVPKGSVTLGWPGTLPEPVLNGATATYPEVLKGVDLQLTATAEGYREVLIVKSAEAAASPLLNEVKLTTTSHRLRIAPGSGGGLRAFDEDGNTIFAGPAGLMWDSAADAGAQPQLMRASADAEQPGPTAETEVPEAVAPDKGDASAELPVQVVDGTVAVKPDLQLLRGDDTVYPVYIDPSLGLGVSERTVLSSDGDRFWNFDGDYGVGRCYRVGPYYCDADHTNRMYFEFAPTRLSGKYVIDATFRAYETWSFSCSPHWVDLWRTGNVSEATRWPGPTQLDLMGDRQVSAGRGDNCSPEQPDSWIEFNDAASETDENLTKTVRSFADGNFSRLTLMLRAKDESNADAWKRFDDNAELKVVYVLKPGAPTETGVIPGNGTVPGCSQLVTNPVVATRPDPMIQGRLQTQVAPASHEERGSLRAYFHAEKKQNDGSWATAWTAADPTTGYQVDNYLAKRRMNPGADGSLYRVKSLTQSFWTYEGRTTAISSGYSPWCYFKIDSTAPKEPQILTNGPYTECTANLCDAKGGPSVAGSFTIKPNTADTDIKSYRWRLLTEPADKTHREDELEAGATKTIHPVPTTAGTQVLIVESIDVRDRTGAPAEFHFKVLPGQGATGRWHFAEASGTNAADSATAGATRHDITLHPQAGTAATWDLRGRRGTADYSLRLNEDVTDPAKQIGYASTSTAPINTQDSFTVSAWVRLADGAKTRVVASAPGAHTSAAFNLFYSGSAKKWVFSRAVADSATPTYVSSLADTANPALHVWTHLTGVFDAKNDTDKANDTIQLFVNGRPQGAPVKLAAVNSTYTPWTSSVGMTVGGSKVGEFFMGNIDELAVWQRELSADEVRLESGLKVGGVAATELVGYWDAASSSGGKVPENTPYASDMNLSATGAVVDPEASELRLDGISGYVSTTGPVIDETGSFTVTARVKLDAAKFATMPAGAKAHVFGQANPDGKESSWALWVEKVSADGYLWRFGRTATDATGRVIATGSVPAEETASLDTWVQVTGVFDATEETAMGYGKTHLFIGATDQVSDSAAGFSIAQQGRGEIAAGRGPSTGTNGNYLPGALAEVRVWTGAMQAEQVDSKVLGAPGAE